MRAEDILRALREAQVLGIIDTFFGDNGKGRITDWLIGFLASLGKRIDIAIRPTGGGNAGHEVQNARGNFKLNCIPSAVCYPDVVKICGNGMVLDPALLIQEMRELEAKGISLHNLYISDRAAITLPWYKTYEKIWEIIRGSEKLGTTAKAIGPTYARKRERTALPMGILTKPRALKQELERIAWTEEAMISGLRHAAETRIPGDALKDLELPDLGQVYEYLRDAGEMLGPKIIDTIGYVLTALVDGKSVLGEGAQGHGLDIDLGTYPYTTSSNTGRAGLLAGSGLPRIDFLLGAAKAYATRVGSGPFPTEMEGDISEFLRAKGKEYGTVSGRPRRIGWRDLVYERYAVRANGIDATVVVKLDILDGLKYFRAGVSYIHPVNEALEIVSHAPSDLGERTYALHQVFPGFTHGGTLPASYAEMHPNCRGYLDYSAKYTGAPVLAASFGPERNAILVRQ